MNTVNEKTIFSYVDYRAYVRDFYEVQRQKAKGFSLSILGKRTGLSKVAIKYLIDHERHIADQKIGVLSKALGLEGNEAAYFASLVRFNKAKDLRSQNQHFLAMLKIKDSPFAELHLTNSEAGLFQDWYYPAIAELSYFPDFQADPLWIQGRLCFKLSLEQIRTALDYLTHSAYLKSHIERPARIKTDDAFASHLYKRFAIQQTELGGRAIEEQARSDREVFNLTISLDARKFELAKEMIAAFRHQLHDFLADESQPERVVQINMQMFTLAKEQGRA